MLTEAQHFIVKEVCSIQYESLIRILIKAELGSDDEGEEYSDIFEELDFTRQEFDDKLIETISNFGLVKKSPEKLFSLEELDIMVFRQILHLYDRKWKNRYPKALANLWNKLFIHSMAISNQN